MHGIGISEPENKNDDHSEVRRREGQAPGIYARIEDLLAALPEIIAEVDTDRTYTWMNRAGREFFGEDAIGKKADFYFEGDQITLDLVRPLFQGGDDTVYVESWQRRKDGEKRLLAWRCRVLKSDGGPILGAVSTARDITERSQAEQALRRSEEKYRVLFENMAYGVFYQSADGSLVDINPAGLEMFGISKDQFLGRTSWHPEWKVVDETFNPLKPEEHPTMRALKTARDVDVVVGVFNPRTENYRWLSVCAKPQFRDGEKTPFQIFATMHDISDRVRAERLLRASEEQFRNLADLAPVGIYLTDPAGHCYYTNPCWRGMAGLSFGEALGDSWIQGLHPDDRAAVFAGWEKVVSSRGRWGQEYRFLARDGRVTWVYGLAAPQHDASGTITGYIGINLDITEKKNAEDRIATLNANLEKTVVERTAQLEASNRELEAFAYSISHDLRAPLRAMEGFSNQLMIRHSAALDEEAIHFLERIQASSQRLGQLINDLLSLSKVTRLGFNNSTVDLSLIATRIFARFAITEPERKSRCEVMQGMTVKGDKNLLSILLDHLIDNAWRFTSEQPLSVIQFGRETRGGEDVHFVKDNGTGFDMAYASQLFKPFSKLCGMDATPGTGIGLVTAEKIVVRHGGRIWAESAPGEGATFFFTLA